MPPTDRYSCFAELEQNEREGLDYRIVYRSGDSGILVMAPHGGNIEPGCSEIADAVAAGNHSFYALEGLKPRGNWDLHIASTRFDEPVCMNALRHARTALAIHGCRDAGGTIYVGGLHQVLRDKAAELLCRSGFAAGMRSDIQGRSGSNVCNRSAGGMGVQIEIPFDLRCRMFRNLKLDGRRSTTELFVDFVSTLRSALCCATPSVTFRESGFKPRDGCGPPVYSPGRNFSGRNPRGK
ncbi:poly-gamma-glutamate hydrolase family protein [Desulfoferrobacter suflitae]|uniref:poly-gamma-glutamate hydrolase family protein n=1 Tax=Desulfoferrobacter suflitae TaxID=2865782 RepID=UPI002164EE38|nr:poly-gamma-glutamate hydrolase family protein [Desulfoferrobacter suflitae]MCK8602909.1 poly-gamma-glutamate hydrolase family protein [Desulfoferrobacter suflitae]